MKHREVKRNSASFVYGVHTVLSVLRNQPQRAKKLFLARKSDVEEIQQLTERRRVPIEFVERSWLEKTFATGSDAQGIVLLCDPFPYCDLETLCDSKVTRILVLDSWQDASNLGRAARAARCFGAQGIIILKDRSAQVNALAEKSAVGALSQVPVARVVNLSAAIKKLQQCGFFVYGADERGQQSIKGCDFAQRVALVIGQEGSGLRQLTKKNCDALVKIPMAHTDICLNAADTALIFLYELNSHTTIEGK